MSRLTLDIQALRKLVTDAVAGAQNAGRCRVLHCNIIRKTVDISIHGGQTVRRNVEVWGTRVPEPNTSAWYLREGNRFVVLGKEFGEAEHISQETGQQINHATYYQEMLMCIDSTYNYRPIVPLLGPDGWLVGANTYGGLELLFTPV